MACTWSVYQGLNEVRGGGAFIISRHYHYYQLSLIVITMGRAAGSGAKRARALSYHRVMLMPILPGSPVITTSALLGAKRAHTTLS